MRPSSAVFVMTALAAAWSAAGLQAGADEIVRFAVIGDNGTGKTPQYEVGAQLAATRASFPFEFVIMLGDNLYGNQRPADFFDKFERPYAPLLQAGVPFYAALGNHDQPGEPPLVPYGVNVVFSRHDHFYQRIKPQQDMSATAFAEDQTFMLVEIAGDRFTIQTITRDGRVVDVGELPRVHWSSRSPS
jgi:hypothetical protein